MYYFGEIFQQRLVINNLFWLAKTLAKALMI